MNKWQLMESMETSNHYKHGYITVAVGISNYMIQTKKAEVLINKCNELLLIIELSINNKLIVVAHADYPHNEY